jgi:UDP-glucose 4-epimerase
MTRLTDPSTRKHEQCLTIFTQCRRRQENTLCGFMPSGVTCIAARLFNAVGARETNAHIVPDILGQVMAGRRTIELGNLEPKRSYIHVADAASGLFALGSSAGIEGFNVFNVGSEENCSVAELLALLSEALGEELVPMQVPERTRRVDRATQQADIGKIRSTIEWGPVRTIRMALAEALKEAFEARAESTLSRSVRAEIGR